MLKEAEHKEKKRRDKRLYDEWVQANESAGFKHKTSDDWLKEFKRVRSEVKE